MRFLVCWSGRGGRSSVVYLAGVCGLVGEYLDVFVVGEYWVL